MSEQGPELLVTLARLREALKLAQIPHVFIGALPVLAWGRPRATTDLDVVIFCEPPSFASLAAALDARSFRAGKSVGPTEPTDALPDIAVYWLDKVRVDIFIAKMDFERAVLATARSAQVLGSELSVASCEASIVYKLIACRSKDLADVESMFEARAAAGTALDWDFLRKWAAEWGVAERLEPFRARFGPR